MKLPSHSCCTFMFIPDEKQLRAVNKRNKCLFMFQDFQGDIVHDFTWMATLTGLICNPFT